MPFLERGIDDLTREDIEQLVRDQVVEDSQVELKREIEFDSGGRVRDGSRNDIAREIVGFANSDGGTLIIGIGESQDEPKRAAAINPAFDCHDLAERLRRAVYEIIEPKLPILHVRAIETDGSAGVVVIVVPHSRRAPHRVESLRDCFRRVGNETRKMSMRGVYDDEYDFEPGSTKFPRYSYGQRSEQPVLINEMSQDILHSTGCRVMLNLNAEISG